MKSFSILIVLVILYTSCNEQLKYKKCQFLVKDEQLLIYNQLLNELVEHHFYSGYLGEDGDSIFRKYNQLKDTTEIQEEIIKLQNEIYKDSSKFCAVVLDTSYRLILPPLSELKKEMPGIVEAIGKLSGNGQEVIDRLNTPQTRYSGKDFNLCTSKVLSPFDRKNYQGCYIGSVHLSRLFLHKRGTRGLLLIVFRQSKRYGKEELFEIERVDSKWRVKKAYLLGIS